MATRRRGKVELRMVRSAACLFLVGTLAGCATPRLIPPGVSGDANSVRIFNTWSKGEALPYAAKHCAAFGKVPKVRKWEPMTLVFDCVVP